MRFARGRVCASNWVWRRRSSRWIATAWRWYRGEANAGLYATRPRAVYDITGAGDVVLAVLGHLLGQRDCGPRTRFSWATWPERWRWNGPACRR